MILALRLVADRIEAGRKARELARLLAAGLPVLDGIVVLAEDELDLALVARSLGPAPYVVRSSSMLEDTEAGSAAGLYDSFAGVGLDTLGARVEAVRASAMSDAVRTYLAERGLAPRPIAVLIQPDLGRCTLGVARSEGAGYAIEERPSSAPEWADADPRTLRRDDDDPLAALLRRVEALSSGPVAVEYARTSRGLVLLQSRPVAPVAASPTSAIAWPPGRWRLDAEHNPDPLSCAQAELVALVDGARFGARARVLGGYLYVRQDQPRPPRPRPVDVLRRYEETVGPRLRAELARASGAPLPEVLAAYRRVLGRYAAEVRPSVGEARTALEELLERTLGESLDEHPALLGGTGGATVARDQSLYTLGHTPSAGLLAQHLARFGAYAPAWDVAAPCDDEDEGRVMREAGRRAAGLDPAPLARAMRTRASEAARVLRARLDVEAALSFDRALLHLRELTTLAESDDLLFFEAQRLVRRALLARGRAFVAAGRLARTEQVFDLPLQLADEGADLEALAERACQARAVARRTLAPYRISDRVPRWRKEGGEVLRGRAAGGHARGPAVVRTSLSEPIGDLPPGAVLIVPAALPSLAPHLSRLAGLVTEHGGALSHAITLARELGVAAVVGVPGATRIRPGAEVYVDGESGRVLVLLG